MSYSFSKKVNSDFDTTQINVETKLKEKGFGILTEINVQDVLKKKIDVDFYKYKILGACNPHFAHKALMEVDNVGVMLPCNVVILQKDDDAQVEVSAVDPMASMQTIENPNLSRVAVEVQSLLKSVIDELE
jgi:uncharacterized protein (DUF302 family)